MTKAVSRRAFLRTASQMSVLGSATPLALNLAAMGSTAAESASAEDYKALVCVFLFGGNDQTNTVVPYDTAAFNAYTSVRAGIARPLAELRPLGPVASQEGRNFALPVELDPLAQLYKDGQLAIVANVGPLFTPTTRTQFQNASVPLPPKLFSHNDQQSVWQSTGAEGTTAGWGGRLADALFGGNAKQSFTAVSAAGTAVFLSGQTTLQYQVGVNGPVAISGLTGSLFGASPLANQTLQQLITAARPTLLEHEYNRVTARSIAAQGELSTALAAAPALTTSFPTGNPLADQLRMVPRLIGVRHALGMKRQVFFVSQGGYDTHDFQLRDQPALHAALAGALAAFHQATVELGVADRVTAFTASDFGRTLTSNGDGSDHGWGSHHFVLGGAVRGGTVYGRFPTVALNTPEDLGSARLLPSTSVDQYAATLGKWLGVSDSDLGTIAPNLANFSVRDLGFLG